MPALSPALRLLPLLLLASAAAQAVDPACDAEAPFTVLEVALQRSTEARAVWLDDRRVWWPGKSAGAHYYVYISHRAALSAPVGEPVRGADRRLRLRATTAAAPARWDYLGAGLALDLAEGDRAALREALRGQTLIVQEDADGRVIDATGLQAAAALDALHPAAERERYGATVRRGGAPRTEFRLWAPTAQQVSLCLYPDGQRPARMQRPLQRDARTGAWSMALPGDLAGQAYAYLVDVVVPGHGLVRNRVTDPYALSLTTDSRRSVVIDLRAADTMPPGWRDTPRPDRVRAPTDLVIYELHVRDFSIGDATVPAAHRGKTLAFGDPRSDGMRHLKRLAEAGVTDVHLLPVFDIATVPEQGCVTPAPEGGPDSERQQALVEATKATDCFNWGYDPLHFTAPEGSYASDPEDGRARVREFRRMVQGLHRLGLRVGMDVVYNHTSASGQHPHSVLDRIVPGYYHRLNPRGEVERSTCCDNTATEHRMMARLMIDSVLVWAREYRIDSFRFDLMGHQPMAVMQQLQREVDRAAGRRIHLIGEGWNFGEVADGRRFVQASQRSLPGSGIATFSDRARDAVRGGGAGDQGVEQLRRQGFINGLWLDPNPHAAGLATKDDLLRAADLVRVGLAGTLRDVVLHTRDGQHRRLHEIDYAGQPAGYASEPGEVVNYVENHDNQTLFDANVFKLPPTTGADERARVQVLGTAVVAFSQGIAYLHAGQELLRSKSMDRNSYDSGDWFNRLDWTLQDNHFGSGLPPRTDNEASWPWMRPLLADPRIKPGPEHIRWTRDAVLDLLRIRASTTLLRLRSAADVAQRLRFLDTGPDQVPGVVAIEIDGRGHPGAGFARLVLLINAAPQAQQMPAPALRGRALRLHPVHRAPGAADRLAAAARFDADRGLFDLPGRTAVAFVEDEK